MSSYNAIKIPCAKMAFHRIIGTVHELLLDRIHEAETAHECFDIMRQLITSSILRVTVEGGSIDVYSTELHKFTDALRDVLNHMLNKLKREATTAKECWFVMSLMRDKYKLEFTVDTELYLGEVGECSSSSAKAVKVRIGNPFKALHEIWYDRIIKTHAGTPFECRDVMQQLIRDIKYRVTIKLDYTGKLGEQQLRFSTSKTVEMEQYTEELRKMLENQRVRYLLSSKHSESSACTTAVATCRYLFDEMVGDDKFEIIVGVRCNDAFGL